MTQDEALAILKTGASVFLTGAPGSGKTHTVNRYLAWLRGHGVPVAVTASTGIAATHSNGVTIHAWSRIGVRENLSRRDLDAIAADKRAARRIEAAKVLIIDEISMLPGHVLGLVDRVCRHLRGAAAPFGGLQVVLVGDFFQLPPVVRRPAGIEASAELPFAETDETPFAYASPAWRDLDPTVCYLTEQHRQADASFLDLLNALRANACTAEHRRLLAERFVAAGTVPRDCPRLFTHNAAVDRINAAELARLPGKARLHAMTASGQAPLVDALKRGCMSPERLALKDGAAVMFTRNDPAGRYVNGTLGIVEGHDEETGLPRVRTRAGKVVLAERAKWSVDDHGRVRATIEQVPLRLAWAITVHKSQGMSLDAAVIDLSRAFEYGQGYVALSRLRSLAGLHLLGLNERALRVHPSAVDRDQAFRRRSQEARAAFAALGRKEIEARTDDFLRACGAQMRPPRRAAAATGSASQPTKAYRVAVERAVHANAYRPWTAEEEAALRSRHGAGDSVAAIARDLGRKPGAIRARLAKLGLA